MSDIRTDNYSPGDYVWFTSWDPNEHRDVRKIGRIVEAYPVIERPDLQNLYIAYEGLVYGRRSDEVDSIRKK